MDFDVGTWVANLHRDLEAQRQQREIEKQAHMEQLVAQAKGAAQQAVQPIPGVDELVARAQAQRRGGTPMQGGRSVLGEGGFGPNVGAPVPGAQVPVPKPPQPNDLDAFYGLMQRGFHQMDSGDVGTRGARGPGAAGIGHGGQFFEVPSQMRGQQQKFSPEQVASAKTRAGERDAELKSRRGNARDAGQQRGFERNGMPSPLAAMMARMDNEGAMGQFARGAVSPQSAAIMQQGQNAEARLAFDREKLNHPTTRIAAIASGLGDTPAKSLTDIIRDLALGKALGGGQETIFGKMPDMNVSSQLDPLAVANAEDPEAFLASVPIETITGNPEAFKAYFDSKFGVGSLDAVIAQRNPTWFDTEAPKRLNEIGPLYGYQEKSKPFFRFGDSDWQPPDAALRGLR